MIFFANTVAENPAVVLDGITTKSSRTKGSRTKGSRKKVHRHRVEIEGGLINEKMSQKQSVDENRAPLTDIEAGLIEGVPPKYTLIKIMLP